MINKRGSIWPTIYVVGTILFIAVFVWMFVIGGSLVKEIADTITPEIRAIGTIENSNITQYANYGLNPVENIINSYGMIASVIYILGIVFIFSMAFIFRNNLSGWTIPFFIFCALLVITTTILLSNAYEEYYNGDDFIGEQLHEQGFISWLILYSPMIMTIVVFIAGIIMMTGGERGGSI